MTSSVGDFIYGAAIGDSIYQALFFLKMSLFMAFAIHLPALPGISRQRRTARSLIGIVFGQAVFIGAWFYTNSLGEVKVQAYIHDYSQVAIGGQIAAVAWEGAPVFVAISLLTVVVTMVWGRYRSRYLRSHRRQM